MHGGVITPHPSYPPEINYFMFYKYKSSQKKTDKNKKHAHLCKLRGVTYMQLNKPGWPGIALYL